MPREGGEKRVRWKGDRLDSEKTVRRKGGTRVAKGWRGKGKIKKTCTAMGRKECVLSKP